MKGEIPATWDALAEHAQDSKRIIVCGSGLSAEYVRCTQPDLFKGSVVAAINGAVQEFPRARFHVIGDHADVTKWKRPAGCLLLGRRWLWDEWPDLHAMCIEDLRGRVEVRNRAGNAFFGGTGAQAIRVFWELASRTGVELVTTGIDLGLWYPHQKPLRYMKNRESIVETSDDWRGHMRPGAFEVFAYHKQLEILEMIADKHRENPTASVRSMSAVNWIDENGPVMDPTIIQGVLDYITENYT